MADTTPTNAISGANCVLTWGSNTYHGITNWERVASVTSSEVQFSSSSGIQTVTIPGGSTVVFNVDILVGQGDATTPAAFQEETTQTTCELHPEGDSAGNIELVFSSGGFVESMRMGEQVGNAMIMSVGIKSLGATTIVDAT